MSKINLWQHKALESISAVFPSYGRELVACKGEWGKTRQLANAGHGAIIYLLYFQDPQNYTIYASRFPVQIYPTVQSKNDWKI